MGALCIFIILMMRVVQNYFNKKTSILFPKTAHGRMHYISASKGVSALLGLILLVFSGFGGLTWEVFVIASVSGLALAGCTICSTLALQSGTMVLSSVCGTAGMIIPCIAGIFLFNDPVFWPVWICIAVFLVASYLLASATKQTNPAFSFKTVLLLLGSFTLNGVTMLCQKLVTYVSPGGSIPMFSLLTFAVPAVIFGVVSIFRKGAETEKLDKRLYLPMIFLAVAVFIINQLATVATKYVSSAVLFSLINGGNTVIAAIIAAVIYGEKPTVKSVIGLILGVGSLILINILQ